MCSRAQGTAGRVCVVLLKLKQTDKTEKKKKISGDLSAVKKHFAYSSKTVV